MKTNNAIPNNDLGRVRNIGIMAHVDAGKTTMAEAILYNAGITHRRGSVDDGTTELDTMPEESTRGITISSACTTFYWEVKSSDVPHLK